MFKHVALLITLVLISQLSYSANHEIKQVGEILSPTEDRQCLLFSLEGVSVSDPSLNQGGEWFAVPLDHNGYNVIVSMLIAAKMASKDISAFTTGGLACNFPKVDRIKIL